jgi:hypothetical protein
MMAAGCFGGFERGDECALTGGIRGTRTRGGRQGASTGRRERRFLDLAGRRLNNGKA